LFEKHKDDLAKIYGEFKEYKSFADIIKMELVRYENTDQTQKVKLDKLLKKTKQLSIDDWILAITSYGIAADQVA
jgi:alanyl-tRNA synthetase